MSRAHGEDAPKGQQKNVNYHLFFCADGRFLYICYREGEQAGDQAGEQVSEIRIYSQGFFCARLLSVTMLAPRAP
jgi:hypothetical protein